MFRIYRPLVSHTEASSIRRCQSSRNLYLEIVRVDQHLRPKTKPGMWALTSGEEPYRVCLQVAEANMFTAVEFYVLSSLFSMLSL
jgi:hypothetical protein